MKRTITHVSIVFAIMLVSCTIDNSMVGIATQNSRYTQSLETFDASLYANATSTAHAWLTKNEATPFSTPEQSPALRSTPTPRYVNSEHVIIFEDDDFMIREKYLGETYDPMKIDRMGSYSTLELGFTSYRDESCVRSDDSSNLCVQAVEIETEAGDVINFELELIPYGFFRLRKNGTLLGGGHLNGGLCGGW